MMPSRPTWLAEGARLGPYEIGALIGAGGMGQVYRARKHEQTHTVSISRFGCLLRSHHDFPLGSTLRIECGYRFILGSVIYCLRDQSTKTSELGIAFYEDGSVLWGTKIPE